jgi:DNA-binding transcriptional MerR regulator
MTTTPRMAVGASLGIVASRLGLTPRALRYYEHRGLIDVSRDRWNCRRYDAAAQRQVEIIARLRRCGLSIEAISEILLDYRAGRPLAAHVSPHLKRRLSDLDAQRSAVLEELARLDDLTTSENPNAPRRVASIGPPQRGPATEDRIHARRP